MRAFLVAMFLLLSVNTWAAFQQPAPPPPAAPAPPKPFDCGAAEYRQFDFWIGEWDVVPNGPPVVPPVPASNTITVLDGGCVLMESWTTQGQTGHSFNIYDRTSGRWHQTWVDNGGGLHEYWGGLKDGNMVLAGEVPLGPGSRFAGRRTVRLTFFPIGPDKVRQFSEALNMDGTWSVNYDLIYTRRARPK